MPRRFRSSVSGDVQTAFNDVFEAGGEIDGTALDLDAISKAPLGTICMDLMMYMQPELFEASMSLLKSCYTQRKSIITAMDRVQVRVRTNTNAALSVVVVVVRRDELVSFIFDLLQLCSTAPRWVRARASRSSGLAQRRMTRVCRTATPFDRAIRSLQRND